MLSHTDSLVGEVVDLELGDGVPVKVAPFPRHFFVTAAAITAAPVIEAESFAEFARVVSAVVKADEDGPPVECWNVMGRFVGSGVGWPSGPQISPV
jgi:hypothetical protein